MIFTVLTAVTGIFVLHFRFSARYGPYIILYSLARATVVLVELRNSQQTTRSLQDASNCQRCALSRPLSTSY